MATIAEQLTALKEIQLGLRTAIEAKGVTVGDVPFIDYPALVGAISDTGYAPPPLDADPDTINEQLSVLKEIQRNLRTAIEANGVPVGGAPFADYPVLVGNIGAGGFDPAAIWGGESTTWGGDPVSFGGS